MPMPLFGRRQSGAKGLEDGEKQKSMDTGPGFTVLSQEEVAARKAKAAAEKERAGRRSIGSLFPNKNKNRVSTFEDDIPGGNRGSSASSAANSSLSHPYSTGSSAHMSSSSTLPSSVGQESADDMHFGRNSHGFQPPPRPLAARDRASTIGMSGMGFPDHPGRYYSHTRDNSTKELPPPPPPHMPQPSYSYDSGFNRHRAMTASSYASTAQPPKLDLGLSNFNDFSTEMFGSREDDDSPPPIERQARAGVSKSPLPPPHTLSPPPLSPYSPHDADAPLLSTSTASPRDRNSANSTFTPQKMTTSSRSQYQPISSSTSTPRNSGNPTAPNPKPRARGDSTAIPPPFTEDELDNEPLFPTTSKTASKAPARAEPEVEPEDDSPKRMVTATEYERLRKLAAQDPQDSEPDEYASDPEEELSDSEQKRRDRWAREKQQADLAVNRQVYKKTVGGSSDQINRFSAQSSAFMAEVNETDADKKQFERDGDWDVPLGALVAHGFPKGGATARPSLSGNRPPTSTSQFEIHTSGQFATPPSRPASATGNFIGASNAQLPAFARNLPADPYSNMAGGVVPSHPREQLRFNGRSSSVPYAQPPMPQIPQAQQQSNSTLVGIIQGEEVAKAARRGSPSAALLASQQQQNMFQQSMQNPYQQPRPMSQMPIGAMQMGNGAMQPEFQTLQQQIAFQQQMMVQMQQQMMQMQMQSSAASMVNGQVPQPMVMPQFPQSNPVQNSFLQLPGQGARPVSMAGGMGNMGFQQRRPDSAYQGSMYAPSVMGMPPPVPRHGGYAPSIAPSERNTTGLSARYRSVGYANGEQHSSAGGSRSGTPGTPGPIKATLKQAGSQGKLQNRSAEESDEERYFAEAAAKARARRAKSSEPTTRV